MKSSRTCLYVTHIDGNMIVVLATRIIFTPIPKHCYIATARIQTIYERFCCKLATAFTVWKHRSQIKYFHRASERLTCTNKKGSKANKYPVPTYDIADSLTIPVSSVARTLYLMAIANELFISTLFL